MILEGLDNGFVWAFAGAVSFWVVRWWPLEGDTCKFIECLLELAHEDFVVITDNVQWEAIFAVPQIKKLSGEVFSRNFRASRRNMYVGPQTICYCDDCVMSIIFGTGTNKIYCYRITSLVRDGKRMQWSRRSRGLAFVALTLYASGDIYTSCRSRHMLGQ